MATNFKWQVVRGITAAPDASGTFSIDDDNAVIDFIFYCFGEWIVVYHTTA